MIDRKKPHWRKAELEMLLGLVGDVPWRAEDRSTLDDHCDLPTPVIAVRTLKADVLVGADPGRCADIATWCGDWLVSGRFGIISVAGANKGR